MRFLPMATNGAKEHIADNKAWDVNYTIDGQARHRVIRARTSVDALKRLNADTRDQARNIRITSCDDFAADPRNHPARCACAECAALSFARRKGLVRD